jgi:hypothetical protein
MRFFRVRRIYLGTKVVTKQNSDLRWGVKRRLEFIDFRLFWDGRFNRKDLSETFGISPQQASTDIAQYERQAPGNLSYDKNEKAYLRASTYRPALIRDSVERYLLQLVAVEHRWMRAEDTWFDRPPPCEIVHLERRRTDPDVLLKIVDAIRLKCELEVNYASITGSPDLPRVIAPHVLVHSAGRWYARAWARHHNDFRDYNLDRILSVGALTPTKADPALDFQWIHRINLEIIPNPELAPERQAAIAAEYGMQNELLEMPCRLSTAFYMMSANNLDVEPGLLAPEKQQLVLRNRAAVEAARGAAREMSIQALKRAGAE